MIAEAAQRIRRSAVDEVEKFPAPGPGQNSWNITVRQGYGSAADQFSEPLEKLQHHCGSLQTPGPTIDRGNPETDFLKGLFGQKYYEYKIMRFQHPPHNLQPNKCDADSNRSVLQPICSPESCKEKSKTDRREPYKKRIHSLRLRRAHILSPT
jgi:hypothetical protein